MKPAIKKGSWLLGGIVTGILAVVGISWVRPGTFEPKGK